MSIATAFDKPTSQHHRMSMVLGMAQLAPQGLSEDWWLKHLGDVHWQMIAQAVGQTTTVFRDREGRQLYAAFCATEFAQHQIGPARLGQTLEIRSRLWAAGRSRIQSRHRLLVDGAEVATVRLVSTFVAHMTAGVNASVRRAAPYLVPMLCETPEDFPQRTAALAKARRSEEFGTGPSIPLTTCVSSDFNAVGLLYFPSFSRLFDRVETALDATKPWRPVRRREVLYFGNIELGEAICGRPCDAQQSGFDLWTSACDTRPARLLAHCALTRHQ